MGSAHIEDRPVITLLVKSIQSGGHKWDPTHPMAATMKHHGCMCDPNPPLPGR